MIDYKLAKELQDVGFPQHKEDEDEDRFYCRLCRKEWSITGCSCKTDTDPKVYERLLIYIPNLSELIDSCGKDLSHIKQMPLGCPEDGKWFAVCHTLEIDGNNPEECGKTPEEAVAKLYIALHDNKD